jgi:alpha-ketoglutarate-dependent taurine dioxygenase
MENYIVHDHVIKELLNSKAGARLPLVIRPEQSGADLSQWVRQNFDQFEKDLTEHGGILLRGFGMDSADKFNSFMSCFNTAPLPYMFRSSPRKVLDASIQNIFLSTSYPSNRSINMHNESSYSRIWGKKIVFCCIQPAEQGGETPIADSRKVLRSISPGLVDKFRRRKIKYRRNLLPSLGMPWQEVFQTDDLNVAKGVCDRYKIEYRMEKDDCFVIEWVKHAICEHPLSKEETWFNHAFFFNKYARYEELGLDHTAKIPPQYLTSDTSFGDGTEISHDEYLELKNAYEVNKIVFPYQKGDVLFLDNLLTAHGRTPYKGDRTIATAVIEADYDQDNILS